MSVCVPPRFDVNSMWRPSRVNDGWLSYPGLLVTFTGCPTVRAPATFDSEARTISVFGGGAAG